jgi:hypothetical protein
MFWPATREYGPFINSGIHYFYATYFSLVTLGNWSEQKTIWATNPTVMNYLTEIYIYSLVHSCPLFLWDEVLFLWNICLVYLILSSVIINDYYVQ